MHRPFFSVVIPTRNRAALAEDAIRSTLRQDFADFELIVSDNSDASDDGRTAALLAALPPGQRIACIRPATPVSMPDHWELATLGATGEYVLVLSDRSVLKRNALSSIATAIRAVPTPPGACAWRWSLFDDQLGIEFADQPAGNSRGSELLPSSRLIDAFAACDRAFPYCLPRGLNSCYRHDVGARLRERYGRLFQPVTPDFFSAFLLLAELPDILYIDQSLFLSQGLSSSNGGDAYQTTTTHYLASLGPGAWTARGPIKAHLVEGAIMEDFLAVKALAGGNLRDVEPDWPAYFGLCYRELSEKRGSARVAPAELAAMFEEWSSAVAALPPSEQQRTRQIVRSMWRQRIKARLKRSPLGPVLVAAQRRFARLKDGRGGSPPRTVMACAGFDDGTEPVPAPTGRSLA